MSIDETADDRAKAADDRVAAMRLTPDEMSSFVSYMCGAAAAEVQRAADFIERLRQGRGE